MAKKKKAPNWKEVNDALRDCDLKTAKDLLYKEQYGARRKGVIKRCISRICKIERGMRKQQLLGKGA